MSPSDEKTQAHKAATELLAQGKDEELRYVALELRRCIEALVYEKLGAYQRWISEKILRTWQAPQAFRALLEIDPRGQDDAVIAFAPQEQMGGPPTGPFKAIGTDRRPKVKWLKDTWNKLGSDLHAEWPYSRKAERTNSREFYRRVLSDLEPFVTSHFTAAMANTIDFPCPECGETIVVSSEGLNATGYATCLNCLLRYSHREQDGKPFFFLEEPMIECEECHHRLYLPSAELKDGYEFQCRHCSTRYRAVVENWAVQRFAEAASNSPES